MSMLTQAAVDRERAKFDEVIAKLATSKRDLPGLYARGDLLDGFVRFCRAELRKVLWDAQVRMATNVFRAPRSLVVSGHATGKDFLTACLLPWWVYCYRGRAIVTGPTDRQVRGIVMATMRRLILEAPALGGELFQTELRLDGVPVITAFTSDNVSRLTGWHHERLLLVMTEAQGCGEDSWEALQRCAVGPDNRVFCYGNPTSPTGPFYQAAHSAQWACLTVPTLDHPNIVLDREEIAGGPSRAWVDFMRAEYGTDSAIYRSAVLAEFPTEAIEAITTRVLLETAFVRHETPTAESVAALARAPVLAWDVALRGEDLNAVAVCQGTIVREVHAWRGADMIRNYARVEQLEAAAGETYSTPARRKRARMAALLGEAPARATLVIDESGMGGPAVDEMKKRGYPVTGFIGAASPTTALAGGAGRYLNLRAEAYFLFRLALAKGTVALPRSEALVEEALATEWQINGQDKIQIISKDDVRRALGRSPDLLDAVVMGLWYTLAAAAQGRWGVSDFKLGG